MGVTYRHDVSPLLTGGLAFNAGQGEFNKWRAQFEEQQRARAQQSQLANAQMQQRAALQTQAEQARLMNQAQINESYNRQAAMNNRARLMQEQMRQNQGAWGRADEGRTSLEELLANQNPSQLVDSGAGMHSSIMNELDRLDEAREQGALRPQDYETAVTRLRGRAQRLQSPRYQKPPEMNPQEIVNGLTVPDGNGGQFVLTPDRKGIDRHIPAPKRDDNVKTISEMNAQEFDAWKQEMAIKRPNWNPDTLELMGPDGNSLGLYQWNFKESKLEALEVEPDPTQEAAAKAMESYQKQLETWKKRRADALDWKSINEEAEERWKSHPQYQIGQAAMGGARVGMDGQVIEPPEPQLPASIRSELAAQIRQERIAEFEAVEEKPVPPQQGVQQQQQQPNVTDQKVIAPQDLFQLPEGTVVTGADGVKIVRRGNKIYRAQ